MNRFSAFEDAALLHRIERLERAEQDLQQRTMARISQVEAEGRWLRSDPQYQRLSSVLKKVREDLRDTEKEILRRNLSAAQKAA
jgi:uncharacterized membrane protein YfbV (UPF0208 family)